MSITTYTYRYSISNHIEISLKISRAIFIFSEITYFLSFISLSLSLIYLKIVKSQLSIQELPLSDNSSLSKEKNGENKTTRRDFIKQGALIFPVTSMLFTTKGVYEGFSSPLFINLTLKYKNLPQSLSGLKIAQISDLHLGVFITLNDWGNILEKLKKMNLDLLLITGDFVDEYSLLDEAVKMLATIKPKYGIYSSAGNHEYSRGMSPVLRAFRKYHIPYLISKGRRIKINKHYLFVGGVDDTHAVKTSLKKGYLKKTLDKTLKYSEKGDFKVLMSHRSKVFPHSADNNVDLTLSGHSHGSQFGFNRRSVLEGVAGNKYLWGEYRKGNSIMYVTSGAGHWFPFRVNCPTEIPVFTLE